MTFATIVDRVPDMSPTTDRGGIQQAIRALRADGWELDKVYDGEELVVVSNETEAIDAITAVDMATLNVRKAGKTGHVLFVLGNSPEEVICDYTTNLDILDKLTESWM